MNVETVKNRKKIDIKIQYNKAKLHVKYQLDTKEVNGY